MNQIPSPGLSERWQALKPWLIALGVIWLLFSVGLGWIVKSFLVLIGIITILPIVAFVGLQWWLSRNLIQGACPVCQERLTALKQAQLNCPNCGTPLSTTNRTFERLSSPGTIDVQAVEVTAQVVDDET